MIPGKETGIPPLPPCEWGGLKAGAAHATTPGKICLFNPYQASYEAFKAQPPPLQSNIKSYSTNRDESMSALQAQIRLGNHKSGLLLKGGRTSGNSTSQFSIAAKFLSLVKM